MKVPQQRTTSNINWREDAACAGMDTDIFFPMASGDPHHIEAVQAQIRIAKAICYSCPVISTCLDESIRLGDVFGIFGGMTAKERRAFTNTPEPVFERSPKGAPWTMTSSETVTEVLHLWNAGMSRDDIFKHLGKGPEAIYKCFLRAGAKVPFSLYASTVGAKS